MARWVAAYVGRGRYIKRVEGYRRTRIMGLYVEVNSDQSRVTSSFSENHNARTVDHRAFSKRKNPCASCEIHWFAECQENAMRELNFERQHLFPFVATL